MPYRSVQQRIRRMAVEQDTEAWYDVHGRAFDNAELLPFVDSMWTAEGTQAGILESDMRYDEI